MNCVTTTCLLLGILISNSVVAQSTESVSANTQNELNSLVGPDEKPDGFAIYQGCTRAASKVANFGTVHESLAAADKLTSQTSRSFTWIATGNLDHANSLAKSNRDTLQTKNCYVYTKSLRCGVWTLRAKTLTFQEAEAYAAKIKDRAHTAIIYELE